MEAVAKKIQFTIESKKVEVVSIQGPVEDLEDMYAYAREHKLRIRTSGVTPGSEGRIFKIIGERDVEPTRGME